MTLVERLEKIVNEINLNLAGSYLNKIQCLSEYDYLFSFSKSKSPSILISLNVKNPFVKTTNQKFMFNTSNQFYLRIKNNQGNVSLSLDLTDIPIVGLANGDPDYTSTKSRTASIYYRDGLVYLRRTDRVSNGIIFTTQYDVNYTSVCQLDYFMDNIMYYLCEFVMGLRSWVMDQIQSSNVETDGQIQYESILKDFYYKEQGSYFFIDINIAELAQNPDLQSLTVKVRVNSETAMLSGLDINLNISVGITIKISASLDLVDVGSEVDLTVMDTFIAAHCNDEINTVIKTATKI